VANAKPGAATNTVIVGRTDEQGRIVIPGLPPGKWRVHAEQDSAEWESSWASLTFELP
jgi:hypothetical protein